MKNASPILHITEAAAIKYYLYPILSTIIPTMGTPIALMSEGMVVILGT